MGGVVPDNAFLQGDLSWLGQSDTVVMLDGWEQSEGAVAERASALKRGTPVFTEHDVPPADKLPLRIPALMVRPDYEKYGWAISPHTHWMDRVDTVVIHHEGGKTADGSSALAIHHYHVMPAAEGGQGWGAIGYHFLIERDGTICEGRPMWAQGAHNKVVNEHSLGVCLIGNLEMAPPTDDQLVSLVRLTKYLRSRGCAVKGDREIRSTACPGKFLDLDWLRSVTA
jgi:N-acetylmuramoyl-L-alanine amidase